MKPALALASDACLISTVVKGDHSRASPLTPSQRASIEKMVLFDAAEIAKDLRIEAVIAAARRYPFGVVKRNPVKKD